MAVLKIIILLLLIKMSLQQGYKYQSNWDDEEWVCGCGDTIDNHDYTTEAATEVTHYDQSTTSVHKTTKTDHPTTKMHDQSTKKYCKYHTTTTEDIPTTEVIKKTLEEHKGTDSLSSTTVFDKIIGNDTNSTTTNRIDNREGPVTFPPVSTSNTTDDNLWTSNRKRKTKKPTNAATIPVVEEVTESYVFVYYGTNRTLVTADKWMGVDNNITVTTDKTTSPSMSTVTVTTDKTTSPSMSTVTVTTDKTTSPSMSTVTVTTDKTTSPSMSTVTENTKTKTYYSNIKTPVTLPSLSSKPTEEATTRKNIDYKSTPIDNKPSVDTTTRKTIDGFLSNVREGIVEKVEEVKEFIKEKKDEIVDVKDKIADKINIFRWLG